ncbi:MAG: PcfB family protein [Oscillospiraceae bacterium]|nr:PcfB family protein [Oscillospiraceae bacterium]
MISIQEEIEQKAVALSIRATKLTARGLAKVMAAALRQIKKSRNSPKAGSQSFKRLDRTIAGDSTDIEIVGRIRSFDRFARKYNVSYHVEKNKGTNPPKWTVCFKSRQASHMTGAFQEYSAYVLTRSRKPSVREAIRSFRDVVKHRVQERDPLHRERGERNGPER